MKHKPYMLPILLAPLPIAPIPPPVEPLREDLKPGEPRGAIPQGQDYPLVASTGSTVWSNFPQQAPRKVPHYSSKRRDYVTGSRSKSEKEARRLARKNRKRNRR